MGREQEIARSERKKKSLKASTEPDVSLRPKAKQPLKRILATAGVVERNYSASDDELQRESNESDQDEIVETLGKQVSDTLLFDEQTDVAGKQIFGFRTPKKRDSMSTLALATSALRTPKTPTSNQHEWNRAGQVQKTPMFVRRKAKEEIAKLIQDAESGLSDFSVSESDYEYNADDSDSSSDDDVEEDDDEEEDDNDEEEEDDDEEEEDNDEEEEDNDEEEEKKRRPHQKHTKPSGRQSVSGRFKVPTKDAKTAVAKEPTGAATKRRFLVEEQPCADYVLNAEGYFTHLAKGKSITSDNTLGRLKMPRLEQESLADFLKPLGRHHTPYTALEENFEQKFDVWKLALSESYNLMLYGAGSKQHLLHHFMEVALSDRTVIVVNGFFPILTPKDVLDCIRDDLLGLRLSSTGDSEILDAIERELKKHQHHIFLLVHNLDGVGIRCKRMQSLLSQLVSFPNVHLVATVDHINAPLMWNSSILGAFNFAWMDATTLLPYTTETSFDKLLMVNHPGSSVISSMRRVYDSLTSNARGILMVIVQYQLKHGGPGNMRYTGMLFKNLYWACREAFLVSSDMALRSQLTEFIDHRVLHFKNGTESLIIPLDHRLLQRFADEVASATR